MLEYNIKNRMTKLLASNQGVTLNAFETVEYIKRASTLLNKPCYLDHCNEKCHGKTFSLNEIKL